MRTRYRMVVAALLTVLAMSALASTSAFAASTNNPQWKVNGALLGNGNNAEVTATGSGRWLIGSYGLRTVCGRLNAKSGAVITGTAAPVAGTSSETLVFEDCEAGGFPRCKINGEEGGLGKITTEPLTGTLAFLTEEAAEQEQGPNVVLLKPTTGKVFMHFIEKENREGTNECPIPGKWTFEGALLLKASEGGTELTHHTFEASNRSGYYVNSGGKTLKEKSGLTAFGGAGATMEGKLSVELANKQSWSIFG